MYFLLGFSAVRFQKVFTGSVFCAEESEDVTHSRSTFHQNPRKINHADAKENPRGKMDLDLDLDLARKLENFPLKTFIQLYTPELTQLTIKTMSVAWKLHANIDRLIQVMEPSEKTEENKQLYKFIVDECEQKRLTCSAFLKVLEITGNQKVLDFIKMKLKNLCFVQHEPQQNSTHSFLSSNQNLNPNQNDIQVHENVDGSQNQVPRICFNILKPVESFQGRRNVLEKLHETIQCVIKETEITVLSQVNEAHFTNQIFPGFGGIGKSETVRQYIFLYGKCYNNIVWIDAESSFTMENSFTKLALELGLAIENPGDGKSLEMKKIVQNVYEKFGEISHGQPEKQLIIFDNADYYHKYQNQNQPAPFSTFNTKTASESESSLSYKNQGALAIASFLPSFSQLKTVKKPRVLITSQNKNWSSNLGKIQILELNTLTKAEGAEFILNQLGIEATPTNLHGATTIVFLVGGHPLALKLATCYLQRHNAEIQKTAQKNSQCLTQSIFYFIEKFKKAADILNLNTNSNSSQTNLFQSSSSFPPHSVTSSQNPTGIQITWEIIMKKLKKVPHGILAIQMNEMLTFLYAENIPVEFVLSFVSKYEEEAAEKSLKVLKKYGIIDILKTTSSDSSEFFCYIKIHRLVQFLTLESMKKTVCGNAKIQDILKTLTNKYRFILESFGLNFKIHDPIFLSIHQLLIDDPLNLNEETSKFLTVRLNYARFLRQAQKYEDSLELLKMVEKNKRGKDGENPSHPNFFEIQMEIAIIHFCQEKYEEDLSMYENIERAQKEHPHFGLGHPETISTKYHKSVTLRKQGNYSRALEEIEQVLKLRKRILWPFYVETLQAEQELAYILYMSGHFPLALKNYQILYAKQSRLFGENDSRSVHSKFFEAMCLLKLGKFADSLIVFRDLHKILVIGCGFGENHAESLNVEMYIMRIMEQQGELGECKRILKKVYPQLQILHAENHEETKNAREWLFYVEEKLENQMKS